MSKLAKGALIGGVVGAGIAWLNFSKKGKEVKTMLMEESHKIAKAAIAKIPKNDYVDPKKVDAFLNDFVEKYSVGKDYAGAFKKVLISETKKRIKNYTKKV